MKVDQISDSEEIALKVPKIDDHTNGITNGETVVLDSKEDISPESLKKKINFQTNGIGLEKNINGLSYKGKKHACSNSFLISTSFYYV